MKRKNPFYGKEWWIDESGSAHAADGDTGDMNHEMYVQERCCREILDLVGYEPREGYCDLQFSICRMALESIGVDYYNDPASALKTHLEERQLWKKAFPSHAMFNDAWAVASGETRIDGRVYAMRHWGWKRVAGMEVETWTLTQQDIKLIADGLYDAYGNGDEIPPDEVFNIEVRTTGKYYEGIPWADIDSGDLAQITRGRAINPPRKAVMKRPAKLPKRLRSALRRGTRVEMEHTRSRRIARTIASHHLAEHPRYYQALAKMERSLRRNPDEGKPIYGVCGRVGMANRWVTKTFSSAAARDAWIRDTREWEGLEIERQWETLPKKNPMLGNTGLEFKQRQATKNLREAIRITGGDESMLEEIEHEAFHMAKNHWQKERHAILPAKEWPQLRIASTLALAHYLLQRKA